MPSGMLCRVMARMSRQVLGPGAVLEKLGGEVGEQAVHGHQKEDAQGGAPCCGQPSGQAHLLGLLNGGDQQRPHTGGDHDPRGKAQHDAVEVGGDLAAEKENHGRPQSGHTKCEAGSAAGPKKRLCQKKNSFPSRSKAFAPADVIEGALSQTMMGRSRGCGVGEGGEKGKKFA